MGEEKKLKVQSTFERDEIENSVIYGSETILYGPDFDVSLGDLKEGMKVMGRDGHYHEVFSVYRPRFIKFRMTRIGIGISDDRKRGGYLEVGEQTCIQARKGGVGYDLVSQPKLAAALNLYEDWVDLMDGDGKETCGCDILKITHKRGDSGQPYLIGIEGLCVVAGGMIVSGCDRVLVERFKRMENKYAQFISRTPRKHAEESDGVREGDDGGADHDDGGDDNERSCE